MVMLFLPKPLSEGEFLEETGLKNLGNSPVVLDKHRARGGCIQLAQSSCGRAQGEHKTSNPLLDPLFCVFRLQELFRGYYFVYTK